MQRNIVIYLIIASIGFILGFSNPEGKIAFLVKKSAEKSIKTYGGWKTNLKIGRNDQGHLMRAIVAKIGLGANTSDEAIYLTCTHDKEGNPIDANNDYLVIFPKSIPVDAFWSLTLYGADEYLIDNDFNKHGVSSFQNLNKKADGSIEVLLSKEQPENLTNWIPLPQKNQTLTLTLRCYHPKEELLKNIEEVTFPIVQKIN